MNTTANNNNNNKIVLNNQQQGDNHLHQPSPLRTIVNNLHEGGDEEEDDSHPKYDDEGRKSLACNKCKELQLNTSDAGNDERKNKAVAISSNHFNNAKKQKGGVGGGGGCVNLAFVDAAVEASSWYQPRLSRQLAVKILADCPVGSFVVRQSQTHSGAGCLALTVRVPRSLGTALVLHYLVLVTAEGFRIKGFTKVFPSLGGLVVHHSVMKESLPCRLLIEDDMASGSAGESDRESDFADLDSEPDYPGLITRLREQLSQ